MRQKSKSTRVSSEGVVRDIRRATRKHHAAEEKIRIVLDGLRGETSIAELCRREGIAESMYYAWSKEFLEAGKRRLAGDTARAATTDEVKQQDLKEVVAEQALAVDGDVRSCAAARKRDRRGATRSSGSGRPSAPCTGTGRSVQRTCACLVAARARAPVQHVAGNHRTPIPGEAWVLGERPVDRHPDDARS